jgi:hypothetical protein
MPKRNPVPFHPFLFALFPVLTLAIHNESQNPVQDAWLPLLAALALASLTWLCLNAFFKHAGKSAIATTMFLLLFFSYGQFLTALRSLAYGFGILMSAIPFVESTPALLFWFALWVVLFAATLYLITRSSSELHLPTQFLNVAGLALILIVLVNGSLAYAANEKGSQYIDAWHRNDPTAILPASGAASPRQPNIYYIILDAYGRGDILDTHYHLDNSAFYAFLADRGFYVASQSHSNYMQTPLSLASSLNLIYLDDVANEVGADYPSRLPLGTMIDDNTTFRELRSHGYKIVTFSTGYTYTELQDADIHLAPPWDINAFDNTLIGTTPLPLLLRLPPFKSQYEIHRDRVLYTLDHLVDTARGETPSFVFAHIIAPHPPFVFGAEGQAISPDRRFEYLDGSSYTSIAGQQDYIENYRNQLIFITKKIETTIDQILAASTVPPVIILQSDHGPGSMLDWTSDQNSDIPERLSILNAYYLPDHDYRTLYPGITPVNTFGVILNHLLGTDYKHQPDKSYFSTMENPYRFIDVTDRLAAVR